MPDVWACQPIYEFSVGDTAEKKPQFLHAQFPKINGVNLVNDHICEDLVEMRAERRRIELLRSHNDRFDFVQHYTLEPKTSLIGDRSWTTDIDLYAKYAKGILEFIDDTLYGDGCPTWMHRVISFRLPKYHEKCAAQLGAASLDPAMILHMVDGKFIH